MTDRGDALSDDRTGIEFGSHVMRGRADQFHSAVMSTVIGLCSRKCGKKGMVNVDHSPVPLFGDRRGEDAHIASQDDKIWREIFQRFSKRHFLSRSRVTRETTVDQSKRDCVLSSEIGGSCLVGNDGNNINIEFTERHPREKVGRAIQLCRTRNDDTVTSTGSM